MHTAKSSSARRVLAKTSMLAATIASLAMAAPAFAHPQLVASDPAQGATVAKPAKVTLSFSEPLIAQLSGIDLMMTGMPGMEHHAAMKMPGVKVSVGPDGKSIVAVLPRPLSTGNYEIDWHAVSTDTHRVAGKITFQVK